MQMKKMNGHVFWLNSRAEVYISEAFAENVNSKCEKNIKKYN